MTLTALADGLMFGERYGTAPPRVVALHGWGRDRHDFHELMDSLDGFAVDLPGFGAAPPLSKPGGAADYADILGRCLEDFSCPQILLGHSFGGRVAVVTAATRPSLVAGLVLVGVPLVHRRDRRPAGPSVGYRMVRWANRAGLLSDNYLERQKRRRGSADYRAARGVMRDTLVKVVNETYEDYLPRLGCPVRMVWGGADREVPVEVAERAASLIPGSSLEVVEGGGHGLSAEVVPRIRLAVEALL